ncbi:hypothetical protein [Roseateles sp.]|uniref:hypothetical protein n=1 Tax=Roseateles sp. TaxID=1971397 RepID=UPI00286AFD78|nr:hypothetical protein [Roseateles sp.]
MKVLHLSHTPLVGAPGQICAALREQGVDARWAVLKPENYAGLSFQLDWRWDHHLDEILAFAEAADLIHLHNYIDLDCNDFAPLDFRQLWVQGKPLVRHLHSTPALISRYMGKTEQEVLNCPIPKLVIAQYPERFFSRACIVPNIVARAPASPDRTGKPLRVGYAPSNFRSARISRWDTKGYPETIKTLKRTQASLQKMGIPLELDLITQVPHLECIARKANCDVFIDDLVTGSYHLNTLESLSQGCATLTHLDGRIQTMLAELLKRSDFPALDVRLENLQTVLEHFARQPELARALGAESRLWMQAHWSPSKMAQHFIAAYATITAYPGQAFEERFNPSPAANYRIRDHFDQIWLGRHASWPKLAPAWLTAIKHGLANGFRRLGLKL